MPNQSEVRPITRQFYLLTMVVYGILMLFIGLGGGYFLFANKTYQVLPIRKQPSKGSSTPVAKFGTFPTKRLLYPQPNNWSVVMNNSPLQHDKWWEAEYSVSLSSSDTYPPKISCGLPCQGQKASGGGVTITDFGTNHYSSPELWYNARLNHPFPDGVTYEDGPSLQYKETSFLNLPAYCTYYTDTFDKYVPFTDTEGIPKEVFSNRCYIEWKNNIYDISAAVRPNTPLTNTNFNTVILILKNLQFI